MSRCYNVWQHEHLSQKLVRNTSKLNTSTMFHCNSISLADMCSSLNVVQQLQIFTRDCRQQLTQRRCNDTKSINTKNTNSIVLSFTTSLAPVMVLPLLMLALTQTPRGRGGRRSGALCCQGPGMLDCNRDRPTL